MQGKKEIGVDANWNILFAKKWRGAWTPSGAFSSTKKERCVDNKQKGEKGAGKTALRLQIEEAIGKHNALRSDAKTLVIPYDDLNPILDRYLRGELDKSADQALRHFRLVDHLDG